MIWINFPAYAALIALSWLLAIVLYSYPSKSKLQLLIANVLTIIGIGILITFVTLLWIKLERPPMRTLGETRLWYSIFLPVIGLITFVRWKYKWFMTYSLSLAILFLGINYLNPDTYDKVLMPALQSVWFVPHVVVYIFSYALLAASSLVALKGLYENYFKTIDPQTLNLADNLVYIGFSFLTLGLLFGALWAKEAWGHYWTWDPKETWAFLTWICYLIYMHYRYYHPKKVKEELWILSIAFAILLVAWFGVNYLPSAANSVHVYGN